MDHHSALVDRLAVAVAGPDRFVGHSPPTNWKRVFGGLVVAQALVAAQRTVADRAAHSLHAYFILPGDPAQPISYAVERLRDGRSFATRRVVARQAEQAILTLAASFQVAEDGLSHQAAMPAVPAPESLASEAELVERLGPMLPDAARRFFANERPIELRPTDLKRFYGTRDTAMGPAVQNYWVRAKAALPDDPATHRAALAYISDMTLIDVALIPHGRSIFDPRIQVASLDHALWFHRAFRADDWLLFSQESPSASGARGLVCGSFFTRDGTLVATVVQEGLIRVRSAPSD
jgi:acyl-CoA thioesterase II